MKNTLIALSLVLGIVGCGGDDDDGGGGGGMPGMVNENSAKMNANQTIKTTTDLLASMDPNDGNGAVVSLLGIANQAQTIVTPAVGGAMAGTCDCAGTKCTFQDCGDDAGMTTYTGSIDWTGGNIKTDVTYTTMSAQGNTVLTLETDMTITDTSINGFISSKGEVEVESLNIPGVELPAGAGGAASWNNKVEFMDVTYANGMATGGSIFVKATNNGFTGEATVMLP